MEYLQGLWRSSFEEVCRCFRDKGQVFSICNSDFTNAMTQTGNGLVQAMTGNADCVPMR